MKLVSFDFCCQVCGKNVVRFSEKNEEEICFRCKWGNE